MRPRASVTFRNNTCATGLMLAALAAAACSNPPPSGPACPQLAWDGPQPRTNVVLVVNDTMRRDRVGAYGGPAHTPAFDGFAAAHLRFDAAFTQAPWTKPSMATLFTSLYPSQHGNLTPPDRVDEAGGMDVLGPEVTTLAEVLRAGGYRTAAFVGNPWLDRSYGFAQGFESYDDSFASLEVPGARISRAGLDWLESLEDDRPFFLYLHYMDSHRPYRRPTRWDIVERADALRADRRELEPFAAEMISRLVWLDEGIPAVDAGLQPTTALLALAYDLGLAAFDDALGLLLRRLEQHPAWERTAVLVTSDHGEALFEHGLDNHGNGLYDEELAIPFAARLPGVAQPASLDCPVGLIDVMPTLCRYLGLECPEPTFGASLLDAVPYGAERAVVSEGVIERPSSRALREGRYKLIWQPETGRDGKRHLLFDIVADPLELRDLLTAAPDSPATVEALDRLSRALPGAVEPYFTPQAAPVPLDSEREERLRSLGYIN